MTRALFALAALGPTSWHRTARQLNDATVVDMGTSPIAYFKDAIVSPSLDNHCRVDRADIRSVDA
jgi:hypothetical protein